MHKSYDDGFEALKSVDLTIQYGEIFALLGTERRGQDNAHQRHLRHRDTPSGGKITISGYDHEKDFREARALIGLVPQELTTEAFETVWAQINFSRGLFGKGRDDAYLERCCATCRFGTSATTA